MKTIQTVAAALIITTPLAATSFADEQTDKAVKAYNKKKVSRYPIVEEGKATGATKQIFDGVKKKRGFVTNVMKALAHRPAELQAFIAMNKALGSRKSGLTALERELMIEAFSAKNNCAYCTIVHGANVRVLSKNPFLADQISADYKSADITARQRAIIDFALKVNDDAPSITKADIKKLNRFGLTDEDVWDIAAYTALFNYANRMMTFLEVRPDAPFYEMGRK